MKNNKYNLEYIFKLDDFNLHHGGKVSDLKIKYSINGIISNPVVIVLGGISADHQVSGEGGWWDKLVGTKKAIDTSKYCVLFILKAFIFFSSS